MRKKRYEEWDAKGGFNYRVAEDSMSEHSKAITDASMAQDMGVMIDFLDGSFESKKRLAATSLMDPTGVWSLKRSKTASSSSNVSGTKVAVDGGFQHFQQLLTSTSFDESLPLDSRDLILRELNLPTLSACDRDVLRRPFSQDEIKDTFFSFGLDKSPRLDGYNAEFFKLHWPMIGLSVTTAIQRFFSTGYLLKEWNSTLLVLIPKVVPPLEDRVLASHLDHAKFIGVLWTIWLLRNGQVFRSRRPTSRLISDHLQAMAQQHLVFVQACRDPTRNPLDPTQPTGFAMAQLGHQGHHEDPASSITILIAARYLKRKHKGDFTWVTDSTSLRMQEQQGAFCCAQSSLSLISTACLKALMWAQVQGHRRVQIYTESSHLVSLLQSSTSQELQVRWTLDRIRVMGNQMTSCQIMKASFARVAKARQLAMWCCQHRTIL
ncbi:hypothetical protein BVRB_6g141910 [Beta vulgaris subsp. vulgaris]|nr:hypothetical protein BVRB_6g141910 [Beta vulgaris subsp. vulgaris]